MPQKACRPTCSEASTAHHAPRLLRIRICSIKVSCVSLAGAAIVQMGEGLATCLSTWDGRIGCTGLALETV